jgi:hypothetical protein
MNQPKSAFDTSGPSIWTRDTQLIFINNGKINGSKRREVMRKTEQLNLGSKKTKAAGKK